MHWTAPLSRIAPTVGLAFLLLGGFSAAAMPAANNASVASSASQYKNYRYLYAVHCNGRVDKLDLVQRAQVGSFHLSEHSGSPPAVARLPAPGVRPSGCLARPVATGRAEDSRSGVVHIVASEILDFDSEGRMPFRLLSFSLPDWKLREKRDLGVFDVLNGSPPSMALGADGKLAMTSKDFNPFGKTAAAIRSYRGAEDWRYFNIPEWSGDGQLLEYGDSGYGGIALGNSAQRTVARLDLPPDANRQYMRLAAGGRFALLAMHHSVLLADGVTWTSGTGVLRLFGADGRQVAQVTDKRVAGNWYCIAITPQGLAVFTHVMRGGYRFVPLGRTFGVEPVADMEIDDWGGARPGVVYFGQ